MYVCSRTKTHLMLADAREIRSAGQHGANVYGVPAGVAHSWPKRPSRGGETSCQGVMKKPKVFTILGGSLHENHQDC